MIIPFNAEKTEIGISFIGIEYAIIFIKLPSSWV